MTKRVDPSTKDNMIFLRACASTRSVKKAHARNLLISNVCFLWLSPRYIFYQMNLFLISQEIWDIDLCLLTHRAERLRRCRLWCCLRIWLCRCGC